MAMCEMYGFDERYMQSEKYEMPNIIWKKQVRKNVWNECEKAGKGEQNERCNLQKGNGNDGKDTFGAVYRR